MSSAWRHRRRIAGVPALAGCGPPRVADGALGRGVPRPDGTARDSVRARVFPAGGFACSARLACLAELRVAVAPPCVGGVAVRRSRGCPVAGTSAAPSTPWVTCRPLGLPAGVPESGSVTAISSCGTGCAGTGHAGTGVKIGVGERSAAGAGPSGPGRGGGDGGWGTATQPAVRSTESRRNVVRRGCMVITVPEPARGAWAARTGSTVTGEPARTERDPHSSRRVLTRSRGRPCVSWR